MTDEGDHRRIDAEFNLASQATDPFVAAVRATRMPMLITDPRRPDNPIMFANDAFSKLTGYAREEIVGRNCRFLQGEDTDQRDVARVRDAVSARLPIEIDLRNYRKDGTAFWNRLLVAPVFDADGELTYFFASQYDVTLERDGLQDLSASLQDSEERYRTLFESIDVGFCIVEMKFDDVGRAVDYRIAEANPAFVRQTGADVAGKWVSEFAPDLERHWFDTYGRVALTGEPAHFENRADVFGRWFDVRALRVGHAAAHRVAIFFSDITARKRAEDEVRELNETLEAQVAERTAERDRIWQFSRDMLGVADDKGVWLSVNPAWTQILGWEADEIVGKTSQWIEHPDDVAKTRTEVSHLAGGSPTLDFENRFRSKDGRYRTLNWTASPVGGRLYCVARDVTEEKASLAALQERDTLWRLSRDLMLRCTFDGVMTAVNPAWTDVLGWGEDELVGTNLLALIHPDDMAHTIEGARQLSEGTGHARFDNRYRHRDGSYRWISWSTQPADGYINAIGRDITVERQQAETLRDFEDFARLALTSVGGVGVWTFDVASDRFVCDAAISELYGLDAERGASGLRRSEFLANVHPDDITKLRATMAGGLQASGDLELEYRINHPDGTVRWVLSRGHTYFDDANKPVRRTGVGIETTKQRQLEDALRQSQKMEAVGQLTGGLAHDFNNLLAGISGSLELMLNRMQQGRLKDVERYLLAAQSGAKRAASLTHRLLAFSRRQTLDPKPTDVNRLVAEMHELIQRTVGPGIPVEVVGASGLWPALVDPSQLENALLNLCINARDAMPDGGRITVETANRWMDERTARQRDLPEGQYLSVCVTDTGTGMSAELVEKVFEPFFTTKPIGEGTGLGLSMVYGFARQSGGQARIYSEVGTGTTVCVYLPRHYGDVAEETAGVDRAGLVKATEGKTVLVVEDEPLVRMLVTDTLEDLGYTTIEAGDSAAGLRILQSDVRIDLLISDVGLPGGMNGRQMADAARLVRPDLKVLFVTGYAENAVVGNGNMMPGMAVITKPFQMDQLAARIRSMVEA